MGLQTLPRTPQDKDFDIKTVQTRAQLYAKLTLFTGAVYKYCAVDSEIDVFENYVELCAWPTFEMPLFT